MELSRIRSHERGESVIFEKSLGEVYAEARETMLGTRVKLVPDRAEDSLRVIHDRILRELAGRGWEIGVSVFPASAPAMFQRGHYRLDATKKTGSGSGLGLICHFGSSEFLLRKFMLISEAVRRGAVECGVLALMTRDVKPYVSGRPACYEEAQRLLQVYGQSGFRGVPMVLWGLRPESVQPGLAYGATGLQARARCSR
ncbi:MAG: hypothetical protein A3G35_10070 [candidate division NC10 bacterium RIFCSPLOWO2_12_FULL_66_18]|nr:MAG: hypothetical protein A3H39_03865 [candidate division NC10 bacterium RIFCSPLOWO2_02_FULL_66_22]OGC00580.1 MAG: hypothetical protein A3G35_10070 [candidate division NC10 bacterium RIFCSPLOWO2_12_FULL_66_18]